MRPALCDCSRSEQRCPWQARHLQALKDFLARPTPDPLPEAEVSKDTDEASQSVPVSKMLEVPATHPLHCATHLPLTVPAAASLHIGGWTRPATTDSLPHDSIRLRLRDAAQVGICGVLQLFDSLRGSDTPETRAAAQTAIEVPDAPLHAAPELSAVAQVVSALFADAPPLSLQAESTKTLDTAQARSVSAAHR